MRLVVQDDVVEASLVERGVAGVGGLCDGLEMGPGLFDAHPSLTPAFEVFPAPPSGAAAGADQHAEIDGFNEFRVQGEDALADDVTLGPSARGSDSSVRLEAPCGDVGFAALAESEEVLMEAVEVGEFGLVALMFGDLVVVWEIVVGGDDAAADARGERGLSGPDGSADGDDRACVRVHTHAITQDSLGLLE